MNDHFREEEELFLQTAYPKSKEHIKLHEEFKNSIYAFKKKFDNDDYSQVDQFIELAKNWLVNHILKIDREYVGYCQSTQVKNKIKSGVA